MKQNKKQLTEINQKLTNDKLEEIKNHFVKYGFKINKLTEKEYLSSGVFSDVYYIDTINVRKKWVLKLSSYTENDNEFYQYESLSGYRFKYVAQILYAGEIPIKFSDEFKNGIFCIIQEYVPHSINDLYDILKDEGQIQRIRKVFNDFSKELYTIRNYNQEFKILNERYPEIKKFVHHIYNGIKELKSFDIYSDDIHFNNIKMSDRGIYKIIDF